MLLSNVALGLVRPSRAQPQGDIMLTYTMEAIMLAALLVVPALVLR